MCSNYKNIGFLHLTKPPMVLLKQIHDFFSDSCGRLCCLTSTLEPTQRTGSTMDWFKRKSTSDNHGVLTGKHRKTMANENIGKPWFLPVMLQMSTTSGKVTRPMYFLSFFLDDHQYMFIGIDIPISVH